MKSFKHTADLKQFPRKYPYTYYLDSTIPWSTYTLAEEADDKL